MSNDKRLIEDYLPIEAISAGCAGEESYKKSRFGRPFGHPHQIHKWWATRPLMACRAAVYGALVPASQFVPENGPDNKKQSLGRANAAKFVTELCKYPGNPNTIKKAQEHILDAHAVRLTTELTEAANSDVWPSWVDEFKWPKDKAKVMREHIEAGRAPRPRVLDMFAGGGAIPLEALRLGCEAYALDLNPVAHIIELCTLVYPQKYGKSDPNERGMTGPKGKDGKPTWGGLADEVRYWGEWVLKEVKKEIGDLYPPIRDPEYLSACLPARSAQAGDAQARKGERPEIEFDRKTGRWIAKRKGEGKKNNLFGEDCEKAVVPPGYLTPVAYLWTRTVKCKNPACGATVPLVKQTWLCKKKGGKKTPGRYVALKMVAPRGKKEVRFEVVQAHSEKGLGFDPAAFSKAGNATCPFCGAVADINYVKSEGWSGRMGTQLLAAVCRRSARSGKVYVAPDMCQGVVDDKETVSRYLALATRHGVTIPDEPIANLPSNNPQNSLGITVRPYGFRTFGSLFLPRQLLLAIAALAELRHLQNHVTEPSSDHAKEVTTCLTLWLGGIMDYSSGLCRWKSSTQQLIQTFSQHVLTMIWDIVEANPFGGASGDAQALLGKVVAVLRRLDGSPAVVCRGSATAVPWPDEILDAVVTDPPYYDNVPYADISDFFYVWQKRSIGQLYPQHFGSPLTPKKQEAIADAARHSGDREKAKAAYERMMRDAFAEANRLLKPEGFLAVVYAHKTTLGWSTLVDSLRKAAFTVTEAWPLDTEMKTRLRSMESAALASSIFLVARKREGSATGYYEKDVQPELQEIVRERVETLWKQGISGADLLIACVGAGLRAFTRFERVEYANGEEVPAERFLAEVETVVLETILARLSKEVGGNGGRYSLAGVDPATRFYTLWRYTYRWGELDAGEAIVFANGTHVELEGQRSLSYGSRALIEKKKGKYRLLDFRDRGEDEKLGLPEDGAPAPLIDALHRTLWLMENRPRELAEFLRESRVNREQMRLVAQALAGPALKGGEMADVSPTSELAALSKLTANWRSVVEDAALTPLEREARRTGQRTLGFEKEQNT